MIAAFNYLEILSAFVVLFAIIDIFGAIPIIIDLKQKKKEIHAGRAFIYSLIILVGFLFAGEWILKLFGVDINSFAIAGGLVIFVIALEMILGIEIFKHDGPDGRNSTLVPLVFPLIAGAGSFTSLLSLRAEYALVNIIIALVLNLLVVYIVLKKVDWIEKLIGEGGVYVLRKFFGIILLAISVKLFLSNLLLLVNR